MFKLAIVATTLLAVSGGQPVFAQAAISEPGAYAFYHDDADVLNAGRATLSDSANASANERNTRIDGQARAPQTLSRHHRRSSAETSPRRNIDRSAADHIGRTADYRRVCRADRRMSG